MTRERLYYWMGFLTGFCIGALYVLAGMSGWLP